MYYFPNRPILVAADPKNPLNPKPDWLNEQEKSGRFIAEQKWNGDNALIYTDTMEFWNRHRRKLKYQPPPEVREELEKWPKKSILNAELVHNKTKTVKNRVIVHCTMAWDGDLLLGKTWGYSRKLIKTVPDGKHVVVSPVWNEGFWKLYEEADGEIIEGIILKDPAGKLVFSAVNEPPDVPWMKKIRKKSKKYAF